MQLIYTYNNIVTKPNLYMKYFCLSYCTRFTVKVLDNFQYKGQFLSHKIIIWDKS